MTPFQAVYGRAPPPLLTYGDMRTTNDTLDQQLVEKDTMLQRMKDHLVNAQERMKKYADRKRREVSFAEGEWVFLKVRPYRQSSLALRRNEKLTPKYFGSYKIIARVGSVAYKLELPAESAIHPVFHVSQLKKALGNLQAVQTDPLVLTDDFEWIAIPSDIYAASPDYTEVLVEWKGLPEQEATWEKTEDFKKPFPDFNLEDKVFKQVGSDVRPPGLQVYLRRGKKGITPPS